MGNRNLKEAALEEVKESVIGCTGCDLCFNRNRIVFGEGDADADIMVVAEAPGQTEDETGRPLVGRSGKLLDKWLLNIELERKDIFIANILKCRPPGNRNPKSDEIDVCISFLHKQIDVIKPRVIVLLGAVALKSLFQDKSLGIMKNRGKWREYQGVPVMPTYHPAFLLRQMSEANKNAVKNDFQLIVEKIKKE